MLKRCLLSIAGWLLILVGIPLAPTPIPLGVPMIAIGVALVAPSSPLVRNAFRWIRTKLPGFDRALVAWHPKLPRFIQVLIEQTAIDSQPASNVAGGKAGRENVLPGTQ